MLIRQANSNDRGKWDEYVRNHPDASPYHFWAWKESVANAYNHQGYYFIAEENEQICGVLPLIHMKLPLLQNLLVSLPFCDLAGPLVDSQDTAALLLMAAAESGKKLGANKIEIRIRPQQQPTLPSTQQTQQTKKVSMLLHLPDSSEKLWDGFKSKLRSQVRKAEKNDLFFKWGQLSDIDIFYNVFSKNMHELGSPVHSKKWIQSVLGYYQENAKMGLVFFENQPIGCGIILWCGKTVSIPWASTLREYNRLSPNMLLYWNFLQFSANNGFAMFDFGRSTLEEGTYKFKEQWGAEPQKLYWYDLLGKTKQDKNELSKSRKKVAEMWSKLPLSMANVLGPIIRKRISL